MRRAARLALAIFALTALLIVAPAVTGHSTARATGCGGTYYRARNSPCRLSISQVIAQYSGTQFGPSRNTYGGVGHVKGFTRVGHTYRINVSVTKPPSPYVNVISPRGWPFCSWWNAACWAWGPILNQLPSASTDPSWHFMSNVVTPCIRGVESGFLGSWGGPALSHYLFYSGEILNEPLRISPEGWAYASIGGCFIGILNRRLAH